MKSNLLKFKEVEITKANLKGITGGENDDPGVETSRCEGTTEMSGYWGPSDADTKSFGDWYDQCC